ncbi:hypothetical protein [Vibrio harveyi]|uniref:hypothetical protein n=1 Tax=Vibrio harveyi TaxID=669 RepID=UPI0031B9B019
MKFSDEFIEDVLKNVPGSKKAARGVLIPTDSGNGEYLHLKGFKTAKEVEGLTDDETYFIEFCSKKEIFRLRNISGAHDYLLRLRANAIVDEARTVRVMSTRRDKYEESGRPWSLTQYYHSKDLYHKSYINLLEKKNMKRVKSVPSGMAHIPEVNALCIKSLAGDVVVVSESLEYFYYFMTIAFYGHLYDIELVDRIDALIIALRIIKGSEALDFDIDSRGELPAHIEREIQSLVKSQMQFTFGHEYAHYLCDHIPSADVLMKMSSSKPYLSELAMYSHSLEYEADHYSLKNIKTKSKDYKGITQGAFSVLVYLHFIEEYGNKFGVGDFSVSETHPAAKDRVYKLLDNLGDKSFIQSSDIAEMFKVAKELSEILNERVDSLKEEHPDLFGFYGSLYLIGYKKKILKDRVDF